MFFFCPISRGKIGNKQSWANTDFSLDNLRGNHALHGSCLICCKQVRLGPVKHATCTDFVAKSRTTFYFLQNFSEPATT